MGYAGSHLFLLSYIITELRGQIKVLISFELNVLGHIQPKYFIGGIVTGYNEHPTSFKHVQNLCKRGIIPLRAHEIISLMYTEHIPEKKIGGQRTI